MANPKFIKSERKLATIREVLEIRPIDGADMIEVAVIDGWECVVKKDENFKVGDKVIYIEIDSILPEKPEFEFLRPRSFRIRTIKLRKQISQGLVLPLSYLGENKKYKLDDDVTEELGIMKYDPELVIEREVRLPKPRNKFEKWLMKFEWYRNWKKRKILKSRVYFPGWIVKTDETRIQNLVKLFHEHQAKGTKFVVTEKIDGQSFTAYIDDKDFVGICSRNLGLSKTEDSNYSKMYKKYDLENVLPRIKKSLGAKTVVLQGEIAGPGVQGNKYKLEELECFIFNVITNEKKIPLMDVETLLQENNLKQVPILETGYTLPETIKEVVDKSKGKSVLYNRKREGLVIRSEDYQISFKVINPEFLLEEE